MATTVTIAELKRLYPMPWSYAAINGVVIATDAAGKEVPMFVILDFVCQVTQATAKADARTAAANATASQ